MHRNIEGVGLSKVLVTGADGFIGSHLTESLVRAGYDFRAFILYNSFNSWGWLDHCAEGIKWKSDVSPGEVRDTKGVRKAMKGCDAVFHLAALFAITYSSGLRQSARAVIPPIITQVASGQREIKLGVAHPTRDFNYVADTVEGFIAALNSERRLGEVFNLSRNFEMSNGDTAHAVAGLMGEEILLLTDQEHLRPEKSEVERLSADETAERELLGWFPRDSGVDRFLRGLAATLSTFVSAKLTSTIIKERF